MGKGQLLFKGDKPKKNKKKSKSSSSSSSSSTIGTAKHAPPGGTNSDHHHHPPVKATAAQQAAQSQQQQQQQQLPTIHIGKGKITTSGTVVMGHDTIFEKQLNVGDALLVSIGDNNEEEMRIITMRIGNTSLNLSSSFTSNITIPTNFKWIPKPRNIQQEQQIATQKKQLLQHEQNVHAFGGTYASTQELVFREKTETGSYRIKRQTITSTSTSQHQPSTTRGDLLQLRAKKTSDKYC